MSEEAKTPAGFDEALSKAFEAFTGLQAPPREVSAELRQSAAMVHEVFTAYVQAGFTSQQAMELVKGNLAGGGNV